MTTRAARRTAPATLELAAPVSSVDTEARTITGLAVPYGPVGASSVGAVTFAQGSITVPTPVGRVKFLEQHDPERPIGYALELTDTTAGLLATFHVPEGARGDEALAMARDGRRDGLSVGVMLDAATWDALVERMWGEGDPDEPVAAAGELLEVSHVTIPAFADARVDGSPALAADLAAGARFPVTFATTTDRPAPAGATEEDTTMDHDETVDTLEASASAAAPATLEASRAAARPPAAHEAATITREPVVYTLDGRGPSLVRDAYFARFDPYGHPDAAARFTRHQSMLEAQHPDSVQLLAGIVARSARRGRLEAAVETRTTAPDYIQQGYRPDMLVEAIDRGRPITSRVGTVPLTDATPYRIPVEGEFSGVAEHTEGTAHAPEGDMTVDDALVEPKAISGAYRLSRELIDSSNPALDRIAVGAMARDYRRVSEAKANTALEAASPASLTASTKVEHVSLAIDAFFDANTEQPEWVFVGGTFYSTLRQDKDTTGRPMLARVGATNANGTIAAGATGAEVDGVELVRAYSIDAAAAYAVGEDALHLAESPLRTFRFEEVEGPGVVKLALWAYFAAAATRLGGIRRLATTDETP